jgi:FlgD Ig-like domain
MMLFFKQDSSNGYIDKLNFTYHPFPYYCQPNDVTFYDLDNDGVQEIIYYLLNGIDSTWGESNHVARYNPEINNYELIFYHRPSPDLFTFGFATGDFDNDGKNNFSTGGIEGGYYFYEYVSGNNIKVEYQMQLDTYNAFQSLMTDDMNHDGKKEIWVGSQFFDSQYGAITRVYVLEPAGNESYHIIYQIDIRGLFSFTYGRMRYADTDGDGKKEVFFNNSTLCFCFKYSPARNFYLDFVINIWEDTPGYNSDMFEGGDIADLDSDGIPEIILQKHVYPPFQYKSLFWKRTVIADVKNHRNPVPERFKLYQNYPNPFNPQTTIKFSLPEEAKVNIKIYNILGKEITELLNDTRRSGEYEITWNGRDSNGNVMPSGVYFITMRTKNFSETIKSLLMK